MRAKVIWLSIWRVECWDDDGVGQPALAQDGGSGASASPDQYSPAELAAMAKKLEAKADRRERLRRRSRNTLRITPWLPSAPRADRRNSTINSPTFIT